MTNMKLDAETTKELEWATLAVGEDSENYGCSRLL
jgi:hypothetical protein